MPDTSHCCCVGEDIELCRTFYGCNDEPAPDVTVHISGPALYDADFVTDANGRICFPASTPGTYIWSVSLSPYYADASGTITMPGAATEGGLYLFPPTGRLCLCSANCGPYTLPTTLTLTSANWGPCTLTYNSGNGQWEGSQTAIGPDCSGSTSSSTISYTWDCTGQLTVGVTTCCVVISFSGNYTIRYKHGSNALFVPSFGDTDTGFDCEAIDITYDVSPGPGNAFPGSIPFGCDNTIGAPAAWTLGAYDLWIDTLTLTE
jgi:hypothetical protein